MFTTILLASLQTASAADTPDAPDAPPPRPTYMATRASVAVPSGGLGQVPTAGVAMGVELENGHTFGLRAIYMVNPPANPISGNQRDVEQAWGPVLDYQFHLNPGRNVNFYPCLSLGFVYAAEDGKENIVLPILEAGFGARAVRELDSGDRLFISPEMGVVPGAKAPYTSITVGMIFDPKKGG
ncbi:MAG: hypothetical protein VX899_09860 [Myxococcota bacterium]|nr:hypothetical protein [Myxococcota bacterium]